MAEQSINDNTFYLPDLGEGITEAEVVAWHVQAGDHVVTDQPVVSLETDKAIVDIPAPHAGIIAACSVAQGERISVGDVLFTYSGAEKTQAQPASIVGRLETSTAVPEGQSRTAALRASPRARRRAQELGVTLSDLTPTGPAGVIQVCDVEAAAHRPQLKGVRRAMAERMADAHKRVVRASLTGEADISDWSTGTRTLLRLIRSIGVACDVQPLLNARFDDSNYQLTLQTQVNLGIAMETADGLFVPVLRDITNTRHTALAETLQILKSAVINRTIAAEHLRSQTITLSNFGAVGGHHAEMIVVPPQVAIVGAGRAFDRVVLRDGKPADRRILPLSISFDHRVVTGVETCEFLLALIEDLEKTD
jgi:2-oxoisovalerate dehydrogenase E2 component (dihydrolipoyl transacylase)